MNLRYNFKKSLSMMVFTLILFAGCKEGGGFSGSGGDKKSGADVQKKSERFNIGAAGNGKVDVVFLVDTSSSMKEENASLVAGLQGFVDQISSGMNGLDYQLFVVAATSKLQVSLRDGARMAAINSEVNSHSALWNAYHFLKGNTDKVPAGSLRLRQDAVKELVVLSDDNAAAITAANFGPYVKENAATLGQVHVNGFVGMPDSVRSASCQVTAVGQDYITLANDSAIGGTVDDLCSSDWNALLTRLAEQMRGRSGRQAVFTLKGRPAGAAAISVLVDGQASAAWSYDSAKNQISVDVAKLSNTAHTVLVSY